jgi:type IV pilus assembly protein PilM
MQLFRQFAQLVQDPPPEYIFELSESGIAWARRGGTPELGFHPLDPGVLNVSPMKDNVLRPDVLASAVRSLANGNGTRKRRRAAIILPDFCSRVTVMDFDQFPSSAEEQASLVRFRVKKTATFEVDSSALSFHAQQRPGEKRFDVVVAVVSLEILARYEAPFRSAGFHPGMVTTATLASLELIHGDGVALLARLSGHTLSVAVRSGNLLRVVRTVEMPEVSVREVMSILYPTFAFVEDDLGKPPEKVHLCGFGEISEALRQHCESELGVVAEPLRSRFGTPGQGNAGLLGYLESIEG